MSRSRSTRSRVSAYGAPAWASICSRVPVAKPSGPPLKAHPGLRFPHWRARSPEPGLDPLEVEDAGLLLQVLPLTRRDPLPKHLLKDPAVAHVLDVGRIVDASEYLERRLLPVLRGCFDRELRTRRELVETTDGERLLTGESERSQGLTECELEREDAHHHQVGAVDPLERLGDRGANAHEVRPLRGP